MRFPLSLTHQTPLVKAIKFDASVTDIAKRWKLHYYFFLQSLYFCFINSKRFTCSDASRNHCRFKLTVLHKIGCIGGAFHNGRNRIWNLHNSYRHFFNCFNDFRIYKYNVVIITTFNKMTMPKSIGKYFVTADFWMP